MARARTSTVRGGRNNFVTPNRGSRSSAGARQRASNRLRQGTGSSGG